MAGFSADRDRQIIPRWRMFDKTRSLGELSSFDAPPSHHQLVHDFLASKLEDWKQTQTVAHASDLVGAGVSLRRENEVTEAACFLLRDDLSVPLWARDLAKRALKLTSGNNIELGPVALDHLVLQEQVKTLRGLLGTEPNDPITWVDLSHSYACLGFRDQAERCMTVALQLSTDNRFVVRSASRLWIHLDNPERAYDVISRADRTRYDPWLMAAEIAVGSVANEKSKLVKEARRMLTRQQHAPAHLSELASALATLELSSGNVKRSRKLFRQSLDRPTENSVAQAAWASRQGSSISLGDLQLGLSNVYEARSRISYHEGRWDETLEQCERWLADQPFSSGPCVMGSYVAAVALEDFQASKQFLDWGLRENRSNVMLLNNSAFTHINLGDFKKAQQLLKIADRMQSTDQHRVVLEATRGLLAFRSGNLRLGRKLYSDARLKATQLDGVDSKRTFALASTYHAIEEYSLGTENSQHLISEALRAIRSNSDPIFRVLEERVAEMSQA